jgi:hypothetical protein
LARNAITWRENVRDALLFIRASDGHLLTIRAAIERYGYERAELLSLTAL